MKSIRMFASVVLACAVVASAAFASYNLVVDLAVSAYCRAKALVVDGINLVASVAAMVGHPVITQVQAEAFVMRLAKRERPMLNASWRMCPSI